MVTLVVGAVLAAAATATLILTEDLRLLRLAVVVALWAFVVATMAGIRRDPLAERIDDDDSAERIRDMELELRQEYQLELEREMVARRESELRIEAELRREITEGIQQELAQLRHEVQALHQELLQRLEGGVRLERVAWHAESTRVTGVPSGLRGLGVGGIPPRHQEYLDGDAAIGATVLEQQPPQPAGPVPDHRRVDWSASPPPPGGRHSRPSPPEAEAAEAPSGPRPRRHRYRDDDQDEPRYRASRQR